MTDIMGTDVSGYSFSPSPSDCETVSSVAASQPSSPEVCEKMFIPAAMMVGSSPSDPFHFRYEQPKRSSEYWFDDGSAVIEVENTWYNVHGSILRRQSDFFRENLGKATRKYGFSPGSVLQPLVLDIQKQSFELLLSIIYPSDYWSRLHFTIEEWFGIASVATSLEFKSIRKAALENIFESCGAMELIDLGRKHDLPECITSGFRVLCFAEEPLSLKDGHMVGLEMVIQIARAREMLAKGRKWSEIESEFIP
ncbi:hypothetical protein ACEPAG_3143 [Sanghuangporus baumii]